MRRLSEADVAVFTQAHYDVGVMATKKLTSKAYRIQGAERDYLLKFFDGDDDFLAGQLYARKEMPDSVLPIYKTRFGEWKAADGLGFAYLTDYVEQIPMPLEHRVRDYAGYLGELHDATAVVVDKNDDEISWLYADDYRRIEENFMMLETMMQQYEMKLSRSPFEWQMMMMYPLLYGMYRRSDESLKRFYRLLGRKKKLPMAMNHGDVNVANVLSGVKRTHLINFEDSHFDLPSADMLMFLSHYHQSAGTTQIITDYLKSQSDQLIVHHFFMNSLCVDLKLLAEHLSGNALIDISLLNEKLAPGLIAMSIYDELNAPKKPADKKASSGSTKTSE